MTVAHILTILVFVGLGSIGLAALQEGLTIVREGLFEKKHKEHKLKAAQTQRSMSIVS